MSVSGASVDSPALNSYESGLQTLFGGSASVAAQLSEDDRQKARLIWLELYQPAKRWKIENGAEYWTYWWDLWKSKHWKKRRPKSLSMAVINEVYSAGETFLGHFMDSLPESVVLPRKESAKDIADMLTKLLNWVHDINEFETETELPCRSAFISGFGVRRIDWDYKMDGTRGAPRYSFLDENFLFVAPYTKKIQDADYVVEAKNVPISYIRNTWERGAAVPPGVWDGSLTPLYGPVTPTGDLQDFKVTGSSVAGQSRPGALQKRDKNLATLIEAWIRQDDGSLRYMVCANGIILQDGPTPYNDEAYPYAIYNVIRNKDSVYGHSVVEQLEKMQIELDEIHSYALDQQKYESNNPLVVRRENIEEGKVFSNAPGDVYVDNAQGGQGFYMLTKPGANPRWLEMEDRLTNRIRNISGGVDILHGERPAGVTTLGGMEIIKEQANVVVNKMMKHIRAAIRNEDLLAIERMKQFLKDERVIRVTGEGNVPEYLTVNKRTHLGINGEWERENSIPDDFEADVDFSPVPPGGFQAKFERDMALLQAGVVDQQFVLEDLEFDRSQIDSLTQRKQAAEAQAQQAAMPSPQGASPQAPGASPQDQDPNDVAQNVLGMLMGT